MNKTLKKLIAFIRDNSPEMHRQKNNTQILMFVNGYQSEDFFKIVDHLDDEGYELFWKGNYFGLDLDSFLENNYVCCI